MIGTVGVAENQKSEGAGTTRAADGTFLSVVIRGSCVFGLYSFSRKQLQTY